MTQQEAQIVLLKAFVATGELPKDMADLLSLLIHVTETSKASETP